MLRFRQFESHTTFNKRKVVDDVPQLIKITRRCVSDLVPECFNCNYFDLLTILISEEVYSWLPKISYIRNLKKFPQESLHENMFLLLSQNAEMLRKIIFLPNNLVPFPKSVQIKCPFSNPISVLFDLSKFLMKMCQRHCSHSPRGAGGWAGCAGALGSSCIDTTLLPGVWNWTTGKDPGL